MGWRAANRSDLDWIEVLLFAHIEGSMFLIGNLRDHGFGSDHPHGLTLWVRETRDGVFAITNTGSVMMMAPGCGDAEWQDAGQLLGPREVTAVIGNAAQVRSFIAANELQDHPCQLDRDEPGFVLDMAELAVEIRPDENIIPLADAPRALIEEWRAAYEVEAVNASPDQAQEKARRDIAQYIARDSHRVLLVEGRPVAMAGHNTAFAEAVQVGGVYTPPALRGRGYARRVVGRHMLEARARGATQGVLFAASQEAARAYRSIGFRRAGTFALVLFARPAQIRAGHVRRCT